MFEESNPDAVTLTVNHLVPFSVYRLRIIAVNVVGPSNASDSTKEFQTIQAPPAHPPWNVTVRAMSATEVRVRWIVSFILLSFFFLNAIIIDYESVLGEIQNKRNKIHN